MEEKEERKKAERNRRRAAKKEEPMRTEENGFLPKDDLSQFLALKPYLSAKGRAVVELLEELGHKGINRPEPGLLARLFALFGGEAAQNLAALGPLLGMAGTGGKLDPTALVSLLGSLAQANTARKEKEKEEERE